MREKKRWLEGTPIPALTNRQDLMIRFSEVDSMGVVWHGHYLRYFEDGREAFGRQFDLSYLGAYANGIALPIVQSFCEHKKPLCYGETAWVETQFVNTPAAKIIFNYRIFRKSDETLVASGKTVQVFLDADGVLLLTLPAFFKKWKQQFDLLP